jgi:hypothetical protein
MHQVLGGREWIKTGKDSIVQRFKEILYRMKDKSKTQIWTVGYHLKGPNEAESLKIMFPGRVDEFQKEYMPPQTRPN